MPSGDSSPGLPEAAKCLLNLSPSLHSAAKIGTHQERSLIWATDKTALQSALCFPEFPLFSLQPALWPILAVLALLSSVTEASLDPMSLSPSARDGPSPVLAPPTGHLPGR